jgi:hypothetical protein
MFALWPGDRLNFRIFIKPTFGFPAKRGAGSGTTSGFESQTHHTQKLWIILQIQLTNKQTGLNKKMNNYLLPGAIVMGLTTAFSNSSQSNNTDKVINPMVATKQGQIE